MKHTVVHIHGHTGSGKTKFLEQFNINNGDAIHILQPNQHGAELPSENFGHDGQAAIAIDELAMWDRESVKGAVGRLEDAALTDRKTLILVTQCQSELESLGIELKTKPLVVNFNDKSKWLDMRLEAMGLEVLLMPKS